MRIAIDATPAVHQSAGIGRYTRCIIEALLALDGRNDYRCFYASRGDSLIREELDRLERLSSRHLNFSPVGIPLTARALTILWNRVHLPLPVETAAGICDIVHWTDFVAGPQRYGRSIVTIHDLTFFVVPECADRNLRRYLSRAVPATVQHADAVVAVSQSTKDDVVRIVGIHPDKVHVVYNGVSAEFGPADAGDDARILARHGLANPFILTVGTIEPRKNLSTLLSAYQMLVAKGLRHELVIAGRRGWLCDDVFAKVQNEGLVNRVRILGAVPWNELPALYRQASVFAYPSLYEGFGIPVLEAMACGTPVVASNSSSLPEAAGDAGILIDPLDAEALAEVLRMVIEDSNQAQIMIGRGLERVKQFTWAATGKRLLHLYNSFEGDTRIRR